MLAPLATLPQSRRQGVGVVKLSGAEQIVDRKSTKRAPIVVASGPDGVVRNEHLMSGRAAVGAVPSSWVADQCPMLGFRNKEARLSSTDRRA
jgi:hypothetical protein